MSGSPVVPDTQVQSRPGTFRIHFRGIVSRALVAAPQPQSIRAILRRAMQAMESITAKINAIFDNENDAWQEMTLEVRT